MTRFRHLGMSALALMACTVSVFAHIPRDVMEWRLPPSIRVHQCSSVVIAPSRLTRIQYHNGTSNFVDRVYTLDAHGNTTAMEINAGLLPQVAPQVMRLKQNAADELTTIQTKANPGVQGWTDKTPVHDAEGNLTSDGDSTFGYDYENRLVSISSGSDSATYYYAGDGSRVAAVTVTSGITNTSIFVLDHADPLRRPLAELDENGSLVRRFVLGRGVGAQIEADGTVHYFHHDGQGSTLALSDTNNVVTDAWFYSPYGEIMARTGTTATPYQWCGGVGVRRVSVGGLYFARHRYYHAGLHRWTSRDPAGMAGGANLYAYANLNPIALLDALGLCADRGLAFTNPHPLTGLYEPPTVIRSPQILRQFVPGQVAWDNAQTAWANGNYGQAAGWSVNMVGEQVLFVASLGMATGAGSFADDVANYADDIGRSVTSRSSGGNRVFWSGGRDARSAAESFASVRVARLSR